jgi:hypothetical protein
MNGKGCDLRDEGEDKEGHENQENDATGILLGVEHIDGGGEAESDVEYAGDPYQLLGEGASNPHVGIAQDKGNTQHDQKTDDCVGREPEVVVAVVDAVAVVTLGGCLRP